MCLIYTTVKKIKPPPKGRYPKGLPKCEDYMGALITP